MTKRRPELEIPMTEIRCQARKSRKCHGRGSGAGTVLVVLYGFAHATGRVLSRPDEVRPPTRGRRYVAVRCEECQRFTEVEVRP